MTNNKITITGDLGSGKSAVSALICQQTGYEYVSTGRIQRQLAQELGLDTLEMNRLADTDPSIDERIDGIFVALGQDPKGYVVDSRMAWFFLPKSLKIYLQADLRTSAERILGDPARNSEQYTSIEEAMEKIAARKQSENARFLTKYGADCGNLHNFDLVINTRHRSPHDVAALIVKGMVVKSEGVPFARFW